MSYHKIISVVTEHTASTVIARYALSLAVQCKAELVLYAAHEKNSNQTVMSETGRHSEHLMALASEMGVTVTCITEAGRLHSLLPRRVQLENADLVVYPMTPYKRFEISGQRHTIRHLLGTIKADLAIMHVVSMAKPHPGSILVPLGKSISNQVQRLEFVFELARSFQSKVTLFHITAGRTDCEMPDCIVDFDKRLEQKNIAVTERFGTGDLVKAITVEAITRHNDLIVLGATGRGILRRLFSGNPATDVMHRPPCNTILFRAGEGS